MTGPLAEAQVPDWQWAASGGSPASGQGIARAADGSYTVAGRFQGTLTVGGQSLASWGGDDVLLIQYDAAGQVRWAKQAGGAGRDGATAIASDAAGNLYVAGYFSGSATFDGMALTSVGGDDAFLAKYASSGALLWVRSAGSTGPDYAGAVAVDGAGAALVAGQYQGTITIGSNVFTSAGPGAAFLAKLDAQGTLLWAQNLDNSLVGGVASTSTGQVYVAGTLAPTGGLLAKFNATGTWLWTSAAAGTDATGTSVVTDAQGAVYVAGRFRNTLQLGATAAASQGNYDGFVARFDSVGAVSWANTFGGTEEDQARSVAITGQGNVGITGHFRGSATVGGQELSSGPACSNAFVSCYDQLGRWLWVRQAMGNTSSGGTGLVFDAGSEAGAVTGIYHGQLRFGNTPPLPTTCEDGVFTARLTTNFPDLVVSTTQAIQGSYHHVTITETGRATLSGQLQVTGNLLVQSGGVLDAQCQLLAGPGSFELAVGAELRICHPAGIAETGASGAVQVAGPRRFSPDATYVYNGTAAQQTGPGLPAQVRALTVANAAGLSLTAPLRIAQTLQLAAGNLQLGSQMLTLLSGPAGTAQVANGGGVVLGTATVQRYLDPSLNAGMGYRHLSSPVRATTVADLATASFVPVTNAAYNTSPTPGLVQPFPTVLGYDETRLATTSSSPATFEQGYFSPASNAAPLEVLRGYTVQLAGNQTVDFVGELNSGTYSTTLTRGPSADAGWHLLGNPYPATLDWRRLVRPTGLDDAMYVFQSSGPYTGQYRSYINGMGNPLIALGQGFLVHLSNSNTSVSLTFTDAARSATYAAAPALNRLAADTRPVVRLTLLHAATNTGDETTVYFEAGATLGTNAHYDAVKPFVNASGTTSLSSLSSTGDTLAINGLPPITGPCSIPLRGSVAQPGAYVLTVAQYAHMNGLSCFLHDAITGRSIQLTSTTSYPFQVAQAGSLGNRFVLHFDPTSSVAQRIPQKRPQARTEPR
ncbi:hypothetical protein [Hymenobacter negativus]|uniref:Bulb-type lectin domain-containing protein n=1 Tax=Hymenobacter negativus TaxID=2795026 RepID=A0ABS3QDA9_9BACT|nr:hypothetical protein [Hymenobacter negativus]MBO2009227.1 hypothetical protein [Hymenobacter negativus]